MSFQDRYITLPNASRRKTHVLLGGNAESKLAPLVLLHGLGSSSSSYLPVLLDPAMKPLLQSRKFIVLDLDGHGLSEFSGQQRGVAGLVADLEGLLETMELGKVILVGHSMSGLITSSFAAKHPEQVEKLFLLAPVLVFPDAGKAGMRDRAAAVQTIEGKSGVAQTVSTAGVSEATRQNNPTAVAFIRHLVMHTQPEAYSAACEALAGSGSGWEPSKITCPVHILCGEADYMAGPPVVEGWAKELKQGTSSVMPGIGHWGGIEAPHQVAEALVAFVAE